MFIVIFPPQRELFQKELQESFQMRSKVFYEKLKWDVRVEDGLEKDNFDYENTIYIVGTTPEYGVYGGVRLVPTIGPNMLRDVFPFLAQNAKDIPENPRIWESSRFYLQQPNKDQLTLYRETQRLMIAMLEVGLYLKLTHIVTVTDARVERLAALAKWPLQRLGVPKDMGNVTAVAGLLEVSQEVYQHVRENARVSGPITWASLPLST